VSARRLGLVNDARVTSALPRYDLERIRAPTLAISVADDRFGTYDAARYTAEHIRGARFVGYPTGGHVWIGRHKDMLGEIAALLRSAP
jgi:pimeloyl-ACP methyl ester carboxylesterase